MVEQFPKMEGRQMVMVLAPNKKPKPKPKPKDQDENSSEVADESKEALKE